MLGTVTFWPILKFSKKKKQKLARAKDVENFWHLFPPQLGFSLQKLSATHDWVFWSPALQRKRALRPVTSCSSQHHTSSPDSCYHKTSGWLLAGDEFLFSFAPAHLLQQGCLIVTTFLVLFAESLAFAQQMTCVTRHIRFGSSVPQSVYIGNASISCLW